MPTNDSGNGESPTTANVNATDLDVTSLAEEQLDTHPYVQELKKKANAAHQDMDKTNLSKKELQAENARLRVLAGEDDKPVITKDEPQTVTKAELQEQIWDLKNSNDVELYGDSEYMKDVEKGIPRDYALKTAKYRYQSNPDQARLERQQTMASGTAMGTRNLGSDDLTPAELKGIADGLYSKETALEYRQIQKARGR